MSHIQIKGKIFPNFLQDFTQRFQRYIYTKEHVILGEMSLKYNLTKKTRDLKEDIQIMR